jgi:hypothetical protein
LSSKTWFSLVQTLAAGTVVLFRQRLESKLDSVQFCGFLPLSVEPRSLRAVVKTPADLRSQCNVALFTQPHLASTTDRPIVVVITLKAPTALQWQQVN